MCSDMGATGRWMLSSLIGDGLVPRCKWISSSGKISISKHRFATAVVGGVYSRPVLFTKKMYPTLFGRSKRNLRLPSGTLLSKDSSTLVAEVTGEG